MIFFSLLRYIGLCSVDRKRTANNCSEVVVIPKQVKYQELETIDLG